MEEARLDRELEHIHKVFPYLWKPYGFHVAYFSRDYGMYYHGFIIGLENDVCKILFEKETNSPVEPIALNVGKKTAPFAPPSYSYLAKDGWYSLTGLIYWLADVKCQRDNNAEQDLKNVGQYLELHIDKLLELFKPPEEFDYKFQYYKNLHQDEQITLEKLRAERARLLALGVDSSLEAAFANLSGGKK